MSCMRLLRLLLERALVFVTESHHQLPPTGLDLGTEPKLEAGDYIRRGQSRASARHHLHPVPRSWKTI